MVCFFPKETNRMTMDAKASERTGMELYMGPFRGAVAAGVGALMCAYNKVTSDARLKRPVST
jgi:beta-glucosidase